MEDATTLEVEIKYAVNDAAMLPDLTDTIGQGASQSTTRYELSAVYYDTADVRLSRSKVTLRRRTGGHDDGWHLKLPDIGRGRVEHHTDLDATGDAVPGALRSLVTALTRGAQLNPVARIDTVRYETLWCSSDGTAQLSTCDDHVTAMSFLRGGEKRRWREWEAELSTRTAGTAAGERLLSAVGRQFVTAGAKESTHPSKLAAALGSAVDAASAAAELPTLPAGSPAAVITAALMKDRDRLLTWDPRVRLDEWDAIHQMRVATRECRSHLRIFGCFFADDRAERLSRALRELSQVLGMARDAEVVRDRLCNSLNSTPGIAAESPEARAIVAGLNKDYTRAWGRVIDELNTTRYLRTLDELDALCAHPSVTPNAIETSVITGSSGGDSSAHVPCELLDSLRTAYASVRMRHEATEACRDDVSPRDEHPTAEERALHELRKAVKKLRYSVRAVAATGWVDTHRVATACSRLQDVLGDYQDSVTARELLARRARGAGVTPLEAFILGSLYRREFDMSAGILHSYTPAYAELCDAADSCGWLS